MDAQAEQRIRSRLIDAYLDTPAPAVSAKRCRECGFRKRGANHANGSHHQSARNGKRQ